MTRKITITTELENQILRTMAKLAVKMKDKIYLVHEIKPGKYRTYFDLGGEDKDIILTTKTLKQLIRRNAEFITADGDIFTPKAYEDGMFILQDGKRFATPHTYSDEAGLHGTYINETLCHG